MAAACLLAVACGRGAEQDDRGPLETRAGARPEPAVVEGCLTASGDRFVLTQLRSSDAASPTTTETYQLVNADEQLREYVGRQVRISGEAEAPSVATLQEQAPAPNTPAATTGGAEVSTQESARLETARMSVTSVTPTGDECAAEAQVPDAPR
jgi:hypothetical protein